MNPLPLSQWVEITGTSNMQLYAVLANTGNSQAMKEYYLHDGTQTPYGLYSGTPYADWFSVMPMIVPISNGSPFLDWVANTQHKDWGWLARSPFSLETIAEHIRGLTQVIMPDGDTAFFRYWDGQYFSFHLEYLGQEWASILPVFPFYWVNGQYFTFQVSAQPEPKAFPWWSVPKELIRNLIKQDQTPALVHILQVLQEDYPDIYWSMDEDLLKIKIEHILDNSSCVLEELLKNVIHYLENEQ